MIAVIGSTNLDTVMRVGHLTEAGETSSAKGIKQYLGGKGANQAIGVAKLNSECCFFTSIGNDWAGRFLSKKLSEFNINLYVRSSNDLSGQAFIEVSDEGLNKIIIYSGANGDLYENFIFENSEVIEKAGIILLQGEIPWDTNLYILEKYKKSHCVILDPAPANVEMLAGMGEATYITPNETEFSILTGRQYDSLDQMIAAANSFQKRLGAKLILKLGENGCAYFSDSESFLVSPVRNLKVVDTTGAGDSFNSAFAVALERGESIKNSIKYSVLASGISTMREGTSSAMPTNEEVLAFQKEFGENQPELIELEGAEKYLEHLRKQ